MTPKARHDLDDIFERYDLLSREMAAQSANRAPIPGPWTQAACERTTHEPFILSDGPAAYVGMKREQARRMKARGEKRMVLNQASCYGLEHGHKEVFEACAAHPIDFNKLCGGEVPLAVAINALDTDLINQLVTHGADPKGLRFPGRPQDGNLVNVVVMKCQGKSQSPACERVLRQIVALGADINGLSAADETPLHYAARQKDEAMMTLLLSLGADINRKNRYGGSALDYAELSGDTKVVEFLKAHGGRSNLDFQIRARAQASRGELLIGLCFMFGCKM